MSAASRRQDRQDRQDRPTGPTIDFRYAPSSVWTPICRPDDPHKSLVREDGALLYGFEQVHLASWYFRRTVEFSAQTSHVPVSLEQRTEDARTPITVTTLTYPTCVLVLRTTGHSSPQGGRYDIVQWTIQVSEGVDELLTGLHVDIHEHGSVRHAGAGVAPSHHVYALEPEEMPTYPAFVDEYTEDGRGAANTGARQPVLVSRPQRMRLSHARGFRPASGLETTPEIVGSGQSVGGTVVLPLDGAGTEGVDTAWAERAVEHERTYWQNLPVLDLPFTVPDTELQNMLVASARNILQARDLDDEGRPVFQVGPTVYRGLWMVDGHFLLEAAQYLHLEQDARHGLKALLDRVRPDGSINVMVDLPGLDEHPHSKETGIALTTLVRQWELTGDDAWLQSLWPVVRGALDHIAELRRRARELPEDSPAKGLMPPAFPDGGVAGARPELTTALWTLVGLTYTARASVRIAPDDHPRVRRMREELLEDVRRTAAEHAGTLADGRPYTPMILPGSGSHHTVPGVGEQPPVFSRIRPESATWALAQAIWPGEVFEADDRIVADYLHLVQTLDAGEQIPTGTGWLPYRAMWTYYAAFAAQVQLYAGRPDKARELLYGMCNHAAPTRVWREEQPLAGTGHDQVWGEMPHNWASAELIRLVRSLLVFERADALEILPGAPADWLDHPEGIRVEQTPTRFGRVSVRAHRSGAESPGTVAIEVEKSSRSQVCPRECLLHLPGEGTWRVEVNGVGIGTRRGPGRVPVTDAFGR
ncbi:hypothetical protein [Nocardiopsis kunsanensis]|uniref:hypothetical protein n=1 Tax=Nocardiopsis kunsanensis TaxID=141693 RepID=UPI00034C136F|nr:hypothetical protein [Nocardiopsis kunsanensis]